MAKKELGAKLTFKREPLAVNEIILPFKNRGHFISLLYQCKLISSLDKNLKFKNGVPKPGQWTWHSKCPDNIIPVHKMYQRFI